MGIRNYEVTGQVRGGDGHMSSTWSVLRLVRLSTLHPTSSRILPDSPPPPPPVLRNSVSGIEISGAINASRQYVSREPDSAFTVLAIFLCSTSLVVCEVEHNGWDTMPDVRSQSGRLLGKGCCVCASVCTGSVGPPGRAFVVNPLGFPSPSRCRVVARACWIIPSVLCVPCFPPLMCGGACPAERWFGVLCVFVLWCCCCCCCRCSFVVCSAGGFSFRHFLVVGSLPLLLDSFADAFGACRWHVCESRAGSVWVAC